jgi:hypothetical protein
MNIEAAIIENLRTLPEDEQQEVLDFVKFLNAKNLLKGFSRKIKGMCADLDINITEEDIAEARREMWGSFHKEDI